VVIRYIFPRFGILYQEKSGNPDANSTLFFQSALSLETNQKSVFGAIKVLSSRLSLLEPAHLDHVEGRLAALHQKLTVIADKKQVC
jgi:hypothetical protein